MTGLRRPPVVDINTARADNFVGGGGTVARYEPNDVGSPLSYIDRAEQALEQASTIDVVKDIRDQAEALRLYAKQAQRSFEIQNRCAEIKLLAERKAGLMLIEQDKNKGAAAPAEVRKDIPRLKDLGISYSQSSRWQAIAGIPSETFEHRLEHLKRGGKEITSTGFLRLAKRLASLDKPQRDDGVFEEEKVSEEFRLAVDALRKAIISARSSGWQGTFRASALALVKSLVALIRA